MARTWNTSYPVLNPTAIGGSKGALYYDVKRLVARGAEARRAVTSRQYWKVDLSNILLNEAQYEELLGLQHASGGLLLPILVINTRNHLGESSDGTPAPLGTATGSSQVLQLKKQLNFQNRVWVRDVHFPYVNYPPFVDLAGQDDYLFVPELAIQSNGVQLDPAGYSVDRNTGIVTITNTAGHVLTWTGGFFTSMLFPNSFDVQREGPLFRVSADVALVEPFDV